MNHLIAEQSQLRELEPLIASLPESRGGTGIVAVDTEFLREKTYRAKLCLLQLGIGEHQYCIDVLAIDDLSALADLLTDPQVLKLFHASRQDMEVLYQTLGIIPNPIFDTQLAAALVGYDMQIGHTAIVKEIIGAELPKSQARTDWSKRPLSDKQLAYAADDVTYLAEIYTVLKEELLNRKRLQWFEDEIAAYYSEETYRIDASQAYKRLGGGGFGKRQQYVLKALVNWREQMAIKRDIPRTWVLKDDQLYALANKQPDSSEAVLQMDILSKNSARHLAPKLAKLIKNVEEGEDLIWQRVDPLDKQDKSICSAMMKKLRALAEQHSIAQGLLATRRDIEHLYRHGTSHKLLDTWRAELVAEPLLDLVRSNK